MIEQHIVTVYVDLKEVRMCQGLEESQETEVHLGKDNFRAQSYMNNLDGSKLGI